MLHHRGPVARASRVLTRRAARAAVLEGRTVIAIAHRLFSAHDADRVAVVEDGAATGATPGVVLRSGRDTDTVTAR